MAPLQILLWLALLAATSTVQAGGPAAGPYRPPAAMNFTDRLIITPRSDVAADGGKRLAMLKSLESPMTAAAGQAVSYLRDMSGGHAIFKLGRTVRLSEARQIAEDWVARGLVAHAEPDAILVPLASGGDPRLKDQWALKAGSQVAGGSNAERAWGLATGKGVTVAVLDTGILPHADLAGQVLPGYDFISDPCVANDGGGRDADASDPGDWREKGDCSRPTDQEVRDSSWHGTHVAGIIAAKANNGAGIAGVAPEAKILPLRVLGKAGGSTSDIVDAMRWAVGMPIAGIPNNPTPAKVLNMSLGGLGYCTPANAFAKAIADLKARGAVIVVAAGNELAKVRFTVPAGCPDVLAVHSHARSGHDAYYSNIGPQVVISAPGGDLDLERAGILSTVDGGKKQPLRDNSYAEYQGTSMAAPHVAGTIALMLQRNPKLTAAQIRHTLQQTARPFLGNHPDATMITCTSDLCGAGLLDTFEAVLATEPPDSDDGRPTCTASATPTAASRWQAIYIEWNTRGDSDGLLEVALDGMPQGYVTASGRAYTYAYYAGTFNWSFTATNEKGSRTCTASYTVAP